MRLRRVPLPLLARAPSVRPRRSTVCTCGSCVGLTPRVIAAAIWLASLALTLGFVWALSTQLGLALAVVLTPFVPSCEACTAGSFMKMLARLRPGADPHVDVQLCSHHYAKAELEIEHMERLEVRTRVMH